MAQLSSVSDTEALVQSMLQRLRLQEQRSEQESTASEDLQHRSIQEVVDDVAEETLTGTVYDSPRALYTKWPGRRPFLKASTKFLGLRRGSRGQKDNLSFTDTEEEVPRWERKQLRFFWKSDQISERRSSLIDEVNGHPEPPLDNENYTSPTEGTEDGSRVSEMQTHANAEAQETDGVWGDEPSAQLIPATDSPERDSTTTEDNASSTDSLRQNSQAVDQVVPLKTSNNVRKNKRKWADTRTKKLTQKIKDKWRDRHSSLERQTSQNGEKECQHNRDEQVSSTLFSELKENVALPPPNRESESEVTPCPQSYDSISLSAFDMGFSSSSLMEEIFTAPEWTEFFALSNSHQQVPVNPNDLAAAKQCEIIQSQNVSQPESLLNGVTEAMLTDTDGAAPNVDQPINSESNEHSFNQLTSSGKVSHNQLWTAEINSDQASNTLVEPELNVNGSQSTMNNPDQSNMDDINHNQSESNTGDIMDQLTHMTAPDLNQTSACDVNPYQTEITAPNLDQATTSEINPYQTQMTTANHIKTNTSDINPYRSQITMPTLDQSNTSDMNPYESETTQTVGQSETEDISPNQSFETTAPTNNLSLSEGDENAPQFLPLLDFSFLKAGDGGDGSAHKKKRRSLQPEERGTFIDEDDDDVPYKSSSYQKVQPSPPPFPPPPPPPPLITQRSISLDSGSSISMEIVPKKRKLDCAPRRVRFAEEVVILPAYIQPDVEDWPEETEDNTEEMDDLEDMEDTEDRKVSEDISTTKETTESTQEAQQSIYSWILGITRKTKRKA